MDIMIYSTSVSRRFESVPSCVWWEEGKLLRWIKACCGGSDNVIMQRAPGHFGLTRDRGKQLDVNEATSFTVRDNSICKALMTHIVRAKRDRKQQMCVNTLESRPQFTFSRSIHTGKVSWRWWRADQREMGGRRCWWMHFFVGSYSVSTTILQSLHHQLHSRETVHANDQACHSLSVCVCVCVYWRGGTLPKNFSSNPLPHKQDRVCSKSQPLEPQG